MDYLLDTHTLLWSLILPNKLSSRVKKLFENSANSFWVSSISFWEISLKYTIGKLDLKGIKPEEVHWYSVNSGFDLLELDPYIAATFYKLSKFGNKDPFDRMLAWQAICKNYILLSKDKVFDSYKDAGLKRLW